MNILDMNQLIKPSVKSNLFVLDLKPTDKWIKRMYSLNVAETEYTTIDMCTIM